MTNPYNRAPKAQTPTNAATKGASSAPSRAKLQARVKATNTDTAEVVYLMSKLGSQLMSAPSAYELAKRSRENPITGKGWRYDVELVKVSVK
jgi:hypothetical protein